MLHGRRHSRHGNKDPEASWLEGEDFEDTKKEKYRRNINIVGYVLVGAAMSFLLMAGYQVLIQSHTSKLKADLKVYQGSQLTSEEEEQKRKKIWAEQHERYEAGKAFTIDCVSHLSTHKLSELVIGNSAEIICPRGCRKDKFIHHTKERVLWGTDLYSPDSMICIAAIHGTGKDGGQFKLSVLSGQSTYKGSKKNSVLSLDDDLAHSKSFAVAAIDDEDATIPEVGVVF